MAAAPPAGEPLATHFDAEYLADMGEVPADSEFEACVEVNLMLRRISGLWAAICMFAWSRVMKQPNHMTCPRSPNGPKGSICEITLNCVLTVGSFENKSK